MKILSLLLVLLMTLTACVGPQVSSEAAQGVEAPLSSPLEIAEGATCPPYTPQGQGVYEANWTGDYPEIEKYDKTYATATFGMG